MSCIDCDNFQDEGNRAFYRWGPANIEINGCKKHLLEIFEVLSEAQKEKK